MLSEETEPVEHIEETTFDRGSFSMSPDSNNAMAGAKKVPVLNKKPKPTGFVKDAWEPPGE